MAEYTEREALIRSVTSRKVQEMLRSDLTDKLISGRNPSDWLNGFDVGMQQAINIIAAADVVKVVRCGECIHRGNLQECDGRPLDWYCPNGVRKGEGE